LIIFSGNQHNNLQILVDVLMMGWHWVSCDVLKSLLKAIKFGKLTQQDQGQAVILSVKTNHSAMPMNLY